MSVNVYKYTDSGAPVLGYTTSTCKGKLIDLLDACLVDGYGTISGSGWSKTHYSSINNVAVYRMPGGSRYYLRVDDNRNDSVWGDNYYLSFVQGFASVDDTTVTGTYATGVVMPGCVEPLSDYDYTQRSWMSINSVVVGELAAWEMYVTDRCFYLIMGGNDNVPIVYYNRREMCFFGDYVPTDPNFQYNTMILHSTQSDGNKYNYTYRQDTIEYNNNGKRCRRNWNLVLGSKSIRYYNISKTNLGYGNAIDYPNPATGELLMDKVRLYSDSGANASTIVGRMPGLYEPLHRQPSGNNGFTTISGHVDSTISGTIFNVVPLYVGEVYFDVTNDWF